VNESLRRLSMLRPSMVRHADVVLALIVVVTIGMLLIPLPAFILDLLISVNIAAGVVILLAALFSRRALELATFPSLLLLTTLFRLGLNVATTRMILTKAHAGEVVEAFGQFVVDGDLIVGLVMFLVLTLVQFLVIAKGAERVAEVGARFTLDAMPGKQMSIDAALRSGAITEQDAQHKRDELSRESKLFGNLDGAMKFVKGDAIAGLIMTFLNMCAGLLIGVIRREMSLAEAAEVYAILSVGDALVAQIPALLITLAAGLVVTRVDSESEQSNLGRDVHKELLASPKALTMAALLMFAIGFVPGLPMIPFVLIGSAILASTMARKHVTSVDAAGPEAQMLADQSARAASQKALADRLAPGVLPIGIDLDPTLSEALGLDSGDNELIGELIPQLRDALFLETGVRFPAVRVRGHMPLPRGGFVIRVKDVPTLESSIDSAMFMAMTRPEKLRRLGVDAVRGQHPLSSAPVSLVRAADKDVLEASGIPVWGPAGVIALHLAGVLRVKVKDFVGIHEVSEMVEKMEAVYPSLVREVVPKLVSLGQLVGVLRRLVDEGVSIRDLKTIFEALGDHGRFENDEIHLTERVRAALAAQLAHSYASQDRRLDVILLEPLIEDTVRDGLRTTQYGTTLTLDPVITRSIIGAVSKLIDPMRSSGARPAILTSTDIRRVLRKMLEMELPTTPILSFDELPGDLSIHPLGRAALD